MRIYKPQVTKPIPPGAKRFTPGDGPDKGREMVHYKGRDGQQHRAYVTDKGRMRVQCRTWHVEFCDHYDRSHSLPGFSHEGQTRLLAGQIERLIAFYGQPLPADLKDFFEKTPSRIVSALQECGLLESEQTPVLKPLPELVAMYQQALHAKARNEEHVQRTGEMANEVFKACGFAFWRDVKDQKVEAFLRDLREGDRHVGHRRSNAYLTACQSFCNWVADDRKWARESPLRGIKKLNVREDPRHTRRALEVDQLRKLLQTTADGPERYGMSGRERYLLYRLAAESGLRAGELRRLRRADFNLDAGTVTVRAVKATKNKRTREQALRPGLCADLRDFLASKLPEAKVFGGSFAVLTRRTADVLKEDLQAAGIPYADDQGNVFDFHGLRVECASLLINSGVDPKQAQEIMRHSSIGLTMDIYAKVLGGKKNAQAVESLPDLSLPEAQQQAAVKTGTDGAVGSLRQVCFQENTIGTNRDCMGLAKDQGSGKTAFPMQNRDSGQTHNPLVVGSNPTGPSSQVPQDQALMEAKPIDGIGNPAKFSDSLRAIIEAEPELRLVIQRWPALTREIRQTITQLVKLSRGKP